MDKGVFPEYIELVESPSYGVKNTLIVSWMYLSSFGISGFQKG